ncbi:MAG: mevalonate kinase [Thaumarchaeota archaeon]|nr:mevalonate kinase [Nitrososphaerota archaeon]
MNPITNHVGTSAPAKIILFGEHFVVYNKPAILASIDKRVHVDVSVRNDNKIVIKSNMGFGGSFDEKKRKQLQTKSFKSLVQPILLAVTDTMEEFNASVGLDLNIRSEFPYGVGLGSSAACSVATIAAVGTLFGKLNRKKICNISLNAERLVHRNPSGADSAICSYGGLMLFNKNNNMKSINSDIDLELIVINSGIKRTTGKLVSNVKQKFERDTDMFMDLANTSENITIQALKAIKGEDYDELGALMTLNHSLLYKLGVSKNILDKLVEIALHNGALGAKITGGGGGGCIIVLTNKHFKNKIMKEMKGYETFVSKVERDGIIIK